MILGFYQGPFKKHVYFCLLYYKVTNASGGAVTVITEEEALTKVNPKQKVSKLSKVRFFSCLS